MVAPAVDVGELAFGGSEIRQLWSFLDGSIMALDTRQRLWRSWGLCPRHAWGYALAEIEVHGGKPLSTAILYEDLTRRAARVANARLKPWTLIRRQLGSRATCFTCDYIEMGGPTAAVDERDRAMARRVNQRARVAVMLDELLELALHRSCPACLGGAGIICRLHLLDRDRRPPGLPGDLEALATRLRALINSMTTRRTPVGPPERVSWIEALGWFGGWDGLHKLAEGPATPELNPERAHHR